MAEYGEWNRKGATLSDVTAKKEYGVDRDFIIKGIQARNWHRLAYRRGGHSTPQIDTEEKRLMPKKSAGLLLYRKRHGSIEVFLAHPGGPFWAAKDDGAWSIPKGEFGADEDPLDAARREFREETGFDVSGRFEPMEPVKQPGGKLVYAWAVQGDVDARTLKSNTFSIEWPRGSGKTQEFPEVDRAAWYSIDLAKRKILKGQVPLLDQLERRLSGSAVADPQGGHRAGKAAPQT